MAVLSSGGALPTRTLQGQSKHLPSPRGKGVRQGALMMLSTLPLVPLTAVITNYFDLGPALLVPIVAIALFVGGLFRIFYALLMEDDTPQVVEQGVAGLGMSMTPQFDRPSQMSALPPAGVNAATSWHARPNTAEIYQPPSITENTTRLLDKDDAKNR